MEIDELTFRKGNPFLTPQYNNNIELTYTVKQAANISIGYSKSQDVISDVIERDKDVANKTFINYRNIANSENYSLSINTPLPIAKWWNGFLSTTMYQTKFEARFDDYSFDTKTPIAVNVYAENTFSLPKDIGFEVSGWFNSSSIEGGSMITRPQGQLDLGVKRSFMDKKVSVKLGFSQTFCTLLDGLEKVT
ncbi:MAG: outer membrane beta-barrel protein [Saprospiraceae bacterium]|nr:outer membrane beta-barrel protein [Saprospiraceae bacterium]